jgi:1-acyl-sn-glycerol-3-phosphate acyltransferase
MLRAVLLLAAWLLLGVPAGIVLLPLALVSRDGALLYRTGVRISRIGLAIAGIRIRVRYESPLRTQTPYLFLANHASLLDPPILSAVLLPRRLAMLTKRELTRVPLFGLGLRAAGFVPVARSGSVEDARRSIGEAEAALRAGTSVAIFPEGTRSADGQLLPFKNGPFFLALDARVAVVPVTIRGTHLLWPKGSLRVRRGTVEVVFHAPLDPAEFAEKNALRGAVRERIAAGLAGTEVAH